jgi:hypothetical protein
MPLHDAQGRAIGTFVVARDITERKQAEEILRARSGTALSSPRCKMAS